jgi:hypothetical protein
VEFFVTEALSEQNHLCSSSVSLRGIFLSQRLAEEQVREKDILRKPCFDKFAAQIALFLFDNMATEPNTTPSDPELARLEALAKLLDNQFRVPGTNWRFGLDGLVGLVPYLGDMAGFVVSGILMRTMLRRGAGPLLMLRMLGNYVLDALVGVVPIVGDLFDFGFKANRRNVDLLKRYYADGKAGPSAKWSVALLGIVFFALFVGLIWLVWKLAAMLLGWVWGMM